MLSRWCGLGLGWVDPRDLGRARILIGVGDEPFGMGGPGVGKDLAAGCGLGPGEAVVDVGGGVQADAAAVVVSVVVALDELGQGCRGCRRSVSSSPRPASRTHGRVLWAPTM